MCVKILLPQTPFEKLRVTLRSVAAIRSAESFETGWLFEQLAYGAL